MPKKDTKIILEDINMILKSKTLQDAIEYANGLSSAYEEFSSKVIISPINNLNYAIITYGKNRCKKINTKRVVQKKER